MYKTHNPMVNKFMQHSPDQMADGIMMVVLSIQQKWSSVGVQLKDWRDNGVDSRFVWGNKRKTADWLIENKVDLYNKLLSAENSEDPTFNMMVALLDVPGLGLPKAGFACQLMFGTVGCIDSHNLKRMSIPESVIKYDKKVSIGIREKKVVAYIAALKKRRSEWCWNTWCNLIAKTYPNEFTDSNHVSEVHVSFLTEAY
tara:strand:- start:280 stop:876 length:597 start_codon:yes stop_codon:yes gene_type:complete